MKLILMDYSIINYSIYNKIPHLLIPVITDERKIEGAINWACMEMQDRINRFLEYNVRDMDSFNDKASSKGDETFPRIICIISEANNLSLRIDDVLMKLFLNSNTVGIYFIIFSKFTARNLDLGAKGDLIDFIGPKELIKLVSKNATIPKTHNLIINFDNIDGHEFEYFCADILEKNGYENVEVTKGSGDHGIDILAEKDGIAYAIQCKCYSSNIGNAAVQQAHTGKSIYHKDIAVVITNRYFTQQAIEEAAALGVKLWDRDKLNELIKKANKQ